MKLDEFVKKVYPGATIKEAITKFLPISQNNAKKINDALLFEGVELNSLVKNKIDKGQDLNSSEILDFFKYYTNTEIIRDLLFGEMGDLFQKLNVDISELLTQIPTEQEIREMQKSDLTEESLNQRCRTGFLFNLNMSPTEEEIKAASAVADTLKIAAKSLSNQVEAQKHIDELKFVFPTSYSVYPKEFEQNLSLLRHEYESMVQSADKMSLEILKVMYIFGKNSASQKSTNPCRTLFPILDDRTDATSGAVVLGKMTVKLIGYGKGIMAHEIGHNLFFDETVLPEFRKCDISKHGTEKYLSEDFADRAAISILKKAGLENSPNFGCLLTYYSSDRDLKPNQEEGDKHSPSLLRTLAIAQAKGQVIPESCQSQAKKEFSNAMISCQ